MKHVQRVAFMLILIAGGAILFGVDNPEEKIEMPDPLLLKIDIRSTGSQIELVLEKM